MTEKRKHNNKPPRPPIAGTEILFNGKRLRVYHAEAGGLAVSKRIRIPLPPDADPENPPVFEKEGSWDRSFLLITDHSAIEVGIELSERLISSETDTTLSKYERIHRNVTRWDKETSPENIREIVLTNSVWMSGRVRFNDDSWPALLIRERTLTVNERQLVQSAKIAEADSQRTDELGELSRAIDGLHEKKRRRDTAWRAKGGAATLKLAQCPKEAQILKEYIKRRAASLGRGGMARAIKEGREWFKSKYPDRSPIVEEMHDNSLRNFVTGKTGRRPKGNSKR